MIFDQRPVRNPLVDLGDGVKRSNSTFSEQGHVAYQIKVTDKCSSMLANILLQTSTHPLPCGLGQKVKIQLFQNMVILDMKLKWNHEMLQHGSKYLACRPPPPRTFGMGSIGQTSTFSELGHVAYPIKWNHECSSMVANILPVDLPPTLGMGSIGQNSTFSEHGHIAYQIKGNHEMQQHGS